MGKAVGLGLPIRQTVEQVCFRQRIENSLQNRPLNPTGILEYDIFQIQQAASIYDLL